MGLRLGPANAPTIGAVHRRAVIRGLGTTAWPFQTAVGVDLPPRLRLHGSIDGLHVRILPLINSMTQSRPLRSITCATFAPGTTELLRGMLRRGSSRCTAIHQTPPQVQAFGHSRRAQGPPLRQPRGRCHRRRDRAHCPRAYPPDGRGLALKQTARPPLCRGAVWALPRHDRRSGVRPARKVCRPEAPPGPSGSHVDCFLAIPSLASTLLWAPRARARFVSRTAPIALEQVVRCPPVNSKGNVSFADLLFVAPRRRTSPRGRAPMLVLLPRSPADPLHATRLGRATDVAPNLNSMPSKDI